MSFRRQCVSCRQIKALDLFPSTQLSCYNCAAFSIRPPSRRALSAHHGASPALAAFAAAVQMPREARSPTGYHRPVTAMRTATAYQSTAVKVPQPAVRLSSSAAVPLSFDVLMREDDTTSNAVIDAFKANADFLALSKAETAGILQRDKEDDEKLAVGINYARDHGIIPEYVQVEPVTEVDVGGKSATVVAEEIIRALGSAPQRGCIVVLQGLSGTGKGTVTSKLQQLLPKATSWSNGNLFRALTLLALTYCDQAGVPLTPAALAPERVAQFMRMLTFDQYRGQYAIKVEGLGLSYFVSDIANTKLKEPQIGKNIPTVAQYTQGQVINFAAQAAAKMSADGCNVLMEGRAQTLNYVRSPHRFELMLKDPIINR